MQREVRSRPTDGLDYESYWRLTAVENLLRRFVSLEMSTDREYPDSSAAERNAPRAEGLQTHKVIDQKPHPRAPGSHHEQAVEANGIRRDQRAIRHNSMLQQLASMSVSGTSSAAISESAPSNPLPFQPAPAYAGVLSAPKAVTFTPNDVK